MKKFKEYLKIKDILSKVSSQVFYTEVDRTDKTERTLKIIK